MKKSRPYLVGLTLLFILGLSYAPLLKSEAQEEEGSDPLCQ